MECQNVRVEENVHKIETRNGGRPSIARFGSVSHNFSNEKMNSLHNDGWLAFPIVIGLGNVGERCDIAIISN